MPPPCLAIVSWQMKTTERQIAIYPVNLTSEKGESMSDVQKNFRWRVVDIAVASVIGVVSAFIYWAAAIGWSVPSHLLNGVLPGMNGLLNGLFLFAAPLAAVIVRKPGAAIYAEVVAGVLEALMGNQWGGASTVIIALLQGFGAEVGFWVFGYRRWTLGTVVLSGALSGVAAWAYSFVKHLQGIDIFGKYGVAYLVSTVVSGAIIAGILMWYIYLAIAATGALDSFASGRAIRAQKN